MIDVSNSKALLLCLFCIAIIIIIVYRWWWCWWLIVFDHCQLLATDRGAIWRQVHVETAHFYCNKEVDHLIKETEVSEDCIQFMSFIAKYLFKFVPKKCFFHIIYVSHLLCVIQYLTSLLVLSIYQFLKYSFDISSISFSMYVSEISPFLLPSCIPMQFRFHWILLVECFHAISRVRRSAEGHETAARSSDRWKAKSVDHLPRGIFQRDFCRARLCCNCCRSDQFLSFSSIPLH